VFGKPGKKALMPFARDGTNRSEEVADREDRQETQPDQ
jgi:hypothetical protein